MSALLNNYVEKKVLVLTIDSRILVGTLAGIDNSTNLVLTSTVERVINTPDDDEPSTQVDLGLYLVRGDNVCSVGLVDEDLDASIDWTKVRGNVIGSTKHA
ncbi:lsm domain-containing protein [Ophiostoma piceae UAMH 11346]|uniref:LSM2-LSM8 complex subunit LSM8 n=1 Tax=Ophiostoma piceae (strain UAMH 11346) TaxID=1262450 RepID=S3CNX8_OPHP1|nr:lsm domain-containing protein [Ophiostoma piceae UAMH 11346]